MRGVSDQQRPPVRILNAGSGPLAPAQPLACGPAVDADDPIPVVSADGLARSYLRIFDELGLRPPHTAAQCPVESLRRCFPRSHFDVVHIRNALDHTANPLLGLQQMLEVTRPGGWVLLRHARNEGAPGFVIWSPSLRADVTSWLVCSGLAADVRAEL